jgi:hypothetical protein
LTVGGSNPILKQRAIRLKKKPGVEKHKMYLKSSASVLQILLNKKDVDTSSKPSSGL